MKTDYKAELSIQISSKKGNVWKCLTEPNLVKEIFYGCNFEIEPKIGGLIIYSGSYENSDYTDKGYITDIKVGERLVFDFRSSQDSSPDTRDNYLEVKYELTGNHISTFLKVIQCCSTKAKAQEIAKNWMSIFRKLKEVAENLPN